MPTSEDADYVRALAAAARVKLDADALHLARAVEQGHAFQTGRPVRFRFVRNTEKSPNMGTMYSQDVEPAGRFLLHNDAPGDLPPKWETGHVEFKNPLVLAMALDRDQIYGPTGWKARLHRATGKRGKKLSCLLRKLGFDGIVTVDHPTSTREIVDLTTIPCR